MCANYPFNMHSQSHSPQCCGLQNPTKHYDDIVQYTAFPFSWAARMHYVGMRLPVNFYYEEKFKIEDVMYCLLVLYRMSHFLCFAGVTRILL